MAACMEKTKAGKKCRRPAGGRSKKCHRHRPNRVSSVSTRGGVLAKDPLLKRLRDILAPHLVAEVERLVLADAEKGEVIKTMGKIRMKELEILSGRKKR